MGVWRGQAFWERYFVKVHKTDTCWLWTGTKAYGGYGKIFIGKKQDGRQQSHSAHRVGWVYANGPIPDGMCVLHKCDNPTCVNPDHLFLGSVRDNSLDMVSKGRHAMTLRTRCPSGHEYTSENTRVYKGWRQCRRCLVLEKRLARGTPLPPEEHLFIARKQGEQA